MTAELLTPRDAATIASQLLARRAARWAALGVELDTRIGSDAQMQAAALGVILAGIEQRAGIGAVRDLLPDQATGPRLNAWGDTIELSRAAGETDEDYQARQLAWWQRRLMNGSPAAWVDAVKACSVVTDAFAYPRLQPGTTNTATLGCVTVIARGPAQGDSSVNTRILSPSDLAHINAYLAGTEDADGNAVSDGVPLRPVTSQAGNATVAAVASDPRDVHVEVLNAPTYPFPWQGSIAVSSSTTTTIVVAGDYTSLAGLDALAKVTGSVRGGYTRTTLASAIYAAGDTTFTLAEALPIAPGGTIYPCPPNWEAIRDRVFDLFDSLGPGDTSAPSRWPASDSDGGTLYASAIDEAVALADGVLSVSILAPASLPVSPLGGVQVMLGLLLVEQMT